MLKAKVVRLVLFRFIKMEYTVKEVSIRELIRLIDSDSIDLNPEYQRNYIWSTKDQSYLIDTILKGYPLPSFFVYKDEKGKFEMVDGQQRSKTIYRFVKNNITSSKETGNKRFNEIESSIFLNYKLVFIQIEKLASSDSLRTFYVLINKKGVHLNVPEVNKSEHFDKRFMKLANESLEYQKFIELDLFTDATMKRMNDRAYIEELLGYLHLGVKEKKKVVDDLYNEDISEYEYVQLKNSFNQIIDKIFLLNQIRPINKTRYKQKNDFYTLFSFINENLSADTKILEYQYRVLLVLDKADENGKQFIRPTNEECEALRNYANNCVTQSNSAYARENRLKFFNAILKNTNLNENEILLDVLGYFTDIYGEERIDLLKVGDYLLLDVDKIEA